jgi:hypothetical protein
MRHPIVLGALALSGAVACSAATDRPDSVAPSPIARAVVLKRNEPPASWVEAVENGDQDDDPAIVEEDHHAAVLAVGVHAALVRTSWGPFAVDDRHGLVGKVTLPGPAGATPRFIGFDGRDALYVATEDGRLHRAESVRSAASAGFEQRAQVAGAEAWDAGGDVVVGVTSSAVWISNDGGTTFHATRPGQAEGMRYRTVAVRDDGVVVVAGESSGELDTPLTYVSRDRGSTFVASRLRMRLVYRYGARIASFPAFADAGDDGGVLSIDGVRWTRKPTPADMPLDPWRYPVGFSEVLVAWAPTAKATLHEPEAPLPPAPADEVSGDIESFYGFGFGSSSVGIACAAGLPRPPFGLSVVLGTLGREGPYRSRSRFRLASDGACVGGDDERELEERARCKPDARLVRVPHLVVLDGATKDVRVADLPGGCRPLHLSSARGGGVLFCLDEDRSPDAGGRLFLVDRRGHALAVRGATSGLDGRFAMADDGTLLFPEARPLTGPWRVALRGPSPLDMAASLISVAVDDAVAYRVLPGGAGLAIVRVDAAETRFALVHVAEDGNRTLLLRDAETAGGLVDVVHHIDDGTLHVRRATMSGGVQDLVVLVDGTLGAPGP